MEERVFLSVGILFHLDRFKDKRHQGKVLTLHTYCTHVSYGRVSYCDGHLCFVVFGLFVYLFSIKVDSVASHYQVLYMQRHRSVENCFIVKQIYNPFKFKLMWQFSLRSLLEVQCIKIVLGGRRKKGARAKRGERALLRPLPSPFLPPATHAM